MHIQRTTLNLPADLIEEVRKWFGAATKTEAIVLSLKDSLNRKKLGKYAKELAGSGALKMTQSDLRRLRKNRIS